MFGLGKFNAAVVGTGYMAAQMTGVINASGTVKPYAVVSRDIDRALQFGRENGFKKAYDSMEKMLDDKKVDLVYIATPASEHAEAVRLCIERGKPVLCETPIALTSSEAESLFTLASSLDVLVVEAVHTRFLPFFKQIVSVISSGAIGSPVMLTANIAQDIENTPRLQRPSLGGGALSDQGYFLLHFASMIFGDQVKRIQSSCVFTPTRVDRQLSIVLQYKDDRMAVLSSTTSGNGESRAVIQGTKGYMVVSGLFNYESVTVYGINGSKKAFYKRPKQKSAFEYEAAAFAAAMKSGWKECPEIPHAQSVSIMHMMDFIRRQLGISYEDILSTPLPELPPAHTNDVIEAEVIGTAASVQTDTGGEAAAVEVSEAGASEKEASDTGAAGEVISEAASEQNGGEAPASDPAAQDPEEADIQDLTVEDLGL